MRWLDHKVVLFLIFLRLYLFIFRERGREGEREGEKYQYVVASHVAPTGDLAYSRGMFPDWESNWQLFGSQPTLNLLSYTSQGLFLIYFKETGIHWSIVAEPIDISTNSPEGFAFLSILTNICYVLSP